MERLAGHESGSLNIYLLKGAHYMTRGLKQYIHRASTSNKYSLNYDVAIQPIF